MAWPGGFLVAVDPQQPQGRGSAREAQERNAAQRRAAANGGLRAEGAAERRGEPGAP
jgi:hypothetical protein